MDEFQPLAPGRATRSSRLSPSLSRRASGRSLHSPTFQLNFSALHRIGGARRGCVACIKGVLGGV